MTQNSRVDNWELTSYFLFEVVPQCMYYLYVCFLQWNKGKRFACRGTGGKAVDLKLVFVFNWLNILHPWLILCERICCLAFSGKAVHPMILHLNEGLFISWTKTFSRKEDYIVSNFREKMPLSIFIVNAVARGKWSLLEILEVYGENFILGPLFFFC